ncbi:putative GPN-loop GTPase 2 [Blattamonas nauphoetae]|uniref:GPN-loop GTPase 2 n=1 Tax=Blattamonas nauphoetae TaxID=2049346 RepID=A0ABQ9Y9H4_9EUKA|nr:putative GPN-loop GTPase 2 [Blattamonas nauphoetae]
MPQFGQVIIGPPGSGKTTYSRAVQAYLEKTNRPVSIINLDPANDAPEEIRENWTIDIADLINVEQTMNITGLGPNGAMLYCLETLVKNLDWLDSELEKCKDNYLLFDFPGQVELYSHDHCLSKICSHLTNRGRMQLCCVHLIDSLVVCEPSRIVSSMVLSLNGMMMLGLPHINVLSKLDRIPHYGADTIPISFFTNVPDTDILIPFFESMPSKYSALNEKMAELIADYSLVSFKVLTAKDERSISLICQAADKACGYTYNLANHPAPDIHSMPVQRQGEDQMMHDIIDEYLHPTENGDEEDNSAFRREKT